MIALGNHDFQLIFMRNKKEFLTVSLSDRFADRLICQHPLRILPHLCKGVARSKEFSYSCSLTLYLSRRVGTRFMGFLQRIPFLRPYQSDSEQSERSFVFQRVARSFSRKTVFQRIARSYILITQQFAFALTIILRYCLPGAMPGWCASVGKNTAKCPAGTTNLAAALSA